ncbi:MAG: glycoside hydrolase family 76 protein [Tannerellaceae bacterium]|nr:glycoside hydrolase family 76 protein [Tannerellaceae bacterium]
MNYKLSLLTLLSFIIFVLNSFASSSVPKEETADLVIADSLLHLILDKYQVEKYGLLMETYPHNPDNYVGYLAEGAEQKKNQEVSFLWPYSGMLSGVIALYKHTGEDKYLKILEERILPGLELYWDTTREPWCYQSYPLFNGESDRFYDDNDWLAIDFCDLYELTGNVYYLDKAIQLHRYIYSGWDDKLGGGIYWCEQMQTSKNTCSNAPAAVLCMKLFNLTQDTAYLEQAKETYNWIRKNLCDPDDSVYWDNIRLDGSVDKAKYTYNSGQMIQAGVLLYEESGNEQYLTEAQQTAKGAFQHFTAVQKTSEGNEELFYSNDPWFNVILLRGLTALYKVDKNSLYVDTMAGNARYAWQYTCDENGFLGKDWTGIKKQPYKWLLDNACMIELFTEIREF